MKRPTGRPTDRQRMSRDRNWRIWKLRGLYWNSHPLQGEQLAAHRANVDQALIAIGAEPETQRVVRKRADEVRYENFREAVLGEDWKDKV